MKFTKAAIEKRPAPLTGYDYEWDSALPGFGIKFAATGRHVYLLRFRTKAGVARKLTLGPTSVLTLEQARERARKALLQVADGQDPGAAPVAAAPTMRALADRYMADHARPHKKPRSVVEDQRAWDRHILPAIGADRLAASVTKADVLKMHASMKGTPAAANFAVAVLGKAFVLAEEWGWRPQGSNPCYRFKKFKIQARKLALTAEHLGAIDRACTELQAEGALRASDAALVRCWMLTGARNAELRTARREWVDPAVGGLRLPDTKTGARVIPLPAAAMAIIQALPPQDGPWLFPGATDGAPLANPYPLWERILERAGCLPAGATPHTLRHTVGTLGHLAGLSQKQVADQLGHRNLSTTAIYVHSVTSAQADAAEKIASTITQHWA